jgi:phage major head subunit gpT-like protein
MGTQVNANGMLAAGLRADFWDTYERVKNRSQDSRLSLVMDLGVTATTREHTFGYFEAAPHLAYWRRGDSIPADAMKNATWTVKNYEFARRIAWSKFDRQDDQTQSLLAVARMTGQSAALMPERFFFDLITGTTSTLPAVPNAPDGAAFFATTAGGAARFGATSGNLLTGSGVSTIAQVTADYYAAIEQFLLYQDGQGQPLFSSDMVDAGTVVIHAAADTQIMEQAFKQVRQGTLIGVDAGTTPSNLIQDASRNVTLWASSRLATGSWYIFLRETPVKPTFLMNRDSLREYTSMEGDNNSDHTRSTGEEYIQWEVRQGAGIALPYGAIKVLN